jgi:hypothetical protein
MKQLIMFYTKLTIWFAMGFAIGYIIGYILNGGI